MRSSPESAPSVSSTDVGQPSFSAFRAEYLRADEFCQEVQGFLNQAGVPAVNELRNAGKHLILAVSDAGQIVDSGEFAAGLGHCRRAAYEAYEAGILTALEIIHKFKEDFSSAAVGTVVHGYSDILRKAHAAQKAVEAGRAADYSREADHSARMQAFRDLRDCAETLISNRDEANKLVASGRTLARRFTIQITIALIALAATVSFGLWSSTGYTKFWKGDEGSEVSKRKADLKAHAS